MPDLSPSAALPQQLTVVVPFGFSQRQNGSTISAFSSQERRLRCLQTSLGAFNLSLRLFNYRLLSFDVHLYFRRCEFGQDFSCFDPVADSGIHFLNDTANMRV